MTLTKAALLARIHGAPQSGRPMVMGVVNVTPDSFSDGGDHFAAEQAIAHSLHLASQGADILDIGGESTRPGSLPVSLQEELDRVIPVIKGIRLHTDCPISIDTSKPEVMEAAVSAGANLINDVNALQAPKALEVAKACDVPVVVMHMRGTPETMQAQANYDDVVAEVMEFLTERMLACEKVGMDKKSLIIDPGFGFGKKLDHNVALLARLSELVQSGTPVLAGLSRKSMLGALTQRESPKERLAASLSACLIAAQAGAAIVRVHDVQETCDALKVWAAVYDYNKN